MAEKEEKLNKRKITPVSGVLLAVGEIFLKSAGVKQLLMRKLLSNFAFFLKKEKVNFNIVDTRSRVFIRTDNLKKTAALVRKTFGVVWFSEALFFPKASLGDIVLFVKKNHKSWLKRKETFALRLRKDSGAKEKTDEIIDSIAGVIGREVDLDHPNKEIFIECRRGGWFIYFKKNKGSGGLPLGSQGKVLVLMSGGIDSPPAGWLLAKRGAENVWAHFHSFPLVSRKSIEKVEDLAKAFLDYQSKLRVCFVPFADIQKKIRVSVPAKYRVLLYRRLMLKISEKIAEQEGCKALATGESLGQVSSQTLPNMSITEDAVKIPVLRPLIAMDKQDIVALAKRIDTLDISNRPHEDCCTLFVPRHSTAAGKLELVREFEKKLSLAKLIKRAIEKAELRIFK